MAINIHGGGAQTNSNGLKFEQDTDLKEAIIKTEIFLVDSNNDVYIDGRKIASLFQKNSLYKKFLEPNNINYKDILSRKLLPDEAIYVEDTDTLYILEKKFQHAAGSVDEKLQTCDFKKKQYQRLVQSLGINVEYIYILNDWFKSDSYRDVKCYIKSVGCHFYFNEIPLEKIGLPVLSYV